MKWILAIALLCLCEQAVFGSWSAETKPNQGDSQCPKGQVAAGFIFKEASQQQASSQSSSSNSSSQSQGADGSKNSEQASAQSQSSQVSSFKKISLRVFCVNLDGSNKVAASSSGGGGGGRACKSFKLKEGSKISDQDKNCKDGEFISGVKLGDGDSPEVTVICSKSEEYELDSSIEARTIGPIKFRKGEPAQAQNPSKSNDNGKCQVDAAVALAIDDSGVTIKVASFKKKGKQYDASCKEKKEEAAKEANKTSSSNSTTTTQTNSSSTETSETSSNSTSEETFSKNSTEKSEKSGGDDEPCVCACNQVCNSGGDEKKGGKGSGSNSGGKSKKGKGPHGNNGVGNGAHNGRGKRSGGKGKGHKKGSGSGDKGHKHGSSHSEHSSSSSSTSETRSESSSFSETRSESSSSTTTTSSTLEYKETTYEGKQVFIVSNAKKLKRCPASECNCPCVCKGGKGGDKKGGGSSGDKKDGGSGSKGKKSKKGGKSHHDNGKHLGQKKGK